MVFFDLRGHGRSGTPARSSCTIDQLGRDIAAIIETTVGRRPVVVIGHSMGGMAVLAAARQRPDLFESQVVGVGLMSTAAEGVARAGVARHLRHPAIDLFKISVHTAPRVVQGGRTLARTVLRPLLHAASFRTQVSPSVSRFVHDMIDETSVETIVKFLGTLEAHDESAALAQLAEIPVLVLAGDRDLIIPFENAKAIAAALPGCELVRVRGAGHMVHLEFPDIVNDAIDDLVRRSIDAADRGESVG
ncbi:alpha/beta fold hydrolase [Aldersonia kunmingensis]|uniref:alpha/beta fold hydrolase n=1 Tax=Aldersonia kunmingensis TaxID=408066 RepID=UPI001FE1753D|nr:alpha/beta hydrolase [Aldersonia kunmingensis]